MEVPTTEGFQPIVENQLYKKILTEGSGELPQNGQEVFALYEGSLTNGDVFDSNQSRDSPFNFVLGQGSVIKGWDQGFATMKKGEKAILQIGPDFGYGKSGSGKIPANATLVFEVELLDFKDKKKEKWQLSDQQKLSEAKRFKQQATQAFKKGDFKTAGQLYEDSVSYSQDLTEQQAVALNIAVWSNLSLVYNKTKQYAKAIEYANKVLQKDSKNVKALYRKGTAQSQNGQFDAAKTIFQQLLTIDPNNNQAKTQLTRVKIAAQKVKAKEKNVYSKIFASNYYEDKKEQKPKPKDQDDVSDQEEQANEPPATDNNPVQTQSVPPPTQQQA